MYVTRPAQTAPAHNTRERALQVARELFVENGYAGTSIADIAERLGVTKAAVYYHFRAKSDLLAALILPMFDQFSAIAAGSHRDVRALVERLVDLLAAQRSTIGIIAADPSAMHELKTRAPAFDFASVLDALAGPRPSATRLIRARCALGAIHAAVVGPLMEAHLNNDAPAPVTAMTAHERRVVVQAALGALGEPG